jgi:hypothetical protein
MRTDHLFPLLVLLAACTDGTTTPGSELPVSETETETDADADTDADSDADADADADVDADTDADSEASVVPDPDVLDGRGYAIAYEDLRWIKPNEQFLKVVEDAGGSFSLDYLLFEVIDVDVEANTIDMTAAVGEERAGKLREAECAPIFDAGEPVDFSTNPHFTTASVDMPYHIDDTVIDIFDFTLAGTFTSDASAIRDIVATGLLDIRPIEDLVPIDICLAAALYGSPCVPCPDTSVKCVEVELNGDEAPLDERVTIDRTYNYLFDASCD